jgi:hypothetical protein
MPQVRRFLRNRRRRVYEKTRTIGEWYMPDKLVLPIYTCRHLLGVVVNGIVVRFFKFGTRPSRLHDEPAKVSKTSAYEGGEMPTQGSHQGFRLRQL